MHLNTPNLHLEDGGIEHAGDVSHAQHSNVEREPELPNVAPPHQARGRLSQDSINWNSPRSQSRSRFSPSNDHDVVKPSSSSVHSTRPTRYSNQDDNHTSWYNGNSVSFGPRVDSPQDDDSGHQRFSRRQSAPHPPRAYMNRPYHFADAPSQTSQGTTVGKGGVFEGRESYDDASSQQKRPRLGVMGTKERHTDEEMGYDTNEGPRLEWKNLSKEEKVEVLRLPLTQWMNSNFKNHFVAFLGEFVGTTLFLLIAFAGTEVANIQSQASNSGSDSNTTTGATTGFDVSVLMYISIIFGFSLMVNVWIFFRISGGLFNPAVTLGMLMVRAVSTKRAVWLFIAQMLGSMLASVIIRYLLPQSFNVKTTLSNGTSILQGVFIEAILTAELVFTIFMLAKEKHRGTFIAPVGIGLALFIAEMVGVQFTGGSLNPARSFGPCVITLSFDPEHWIYWVGPFSGAIIAVVFYKFIKTLEYEMANPGADGDPTNDPTVNPEKFAEIKQNRRSESRQAQSLQQGV